MKKRKTKRLLSAALVLSMLLCLCLTACGNSKDCVPDSYIDEDIQRFIKKMLGAAYHPGSLPQHLL